MTIHTAYAVYHERVQLFLAMFAHARQIGIGLRFAIKQIIKQSQRHLLSSAAIGMNMQKVTDKENNNMINLL